MENAKQKAINYGNWKILDLRKTNEAISEFKNAKVGIAVITET